MPSSTSSFDRIPNLPLGRIWVLCIVAVLVVSLTLELFWRWGGHRPSLTDDPLWWAINKQAASQENAVVAIGASRLKLGFSSTIFRERYPDRPLIRLEIAGKGAFELLEDFAKDESFRGTIICSVAPSGDVGRTSMVDYLPVSKTKISFDRRLNRTISAWLQDKVAFLSSEVAAIAVVRHLVEEGCLPYPRHTTNHFDRSRTADFQYYRRPDSLEVRRYRARRWVAQWGLSNIHQWKSRIREVEALVEQIQQRGGQVVFITMPLTSAYYDLNARLYPKYKYWDKFAETTRGVPIHYLELPAIADIECPDGSHIDGKDVPLFTNTILDELERRGVFERNQDLKISPSSTE